MDTRSRMLTLLTVLWLTAGVFAGLLYGPRLLVIQAPEIESQVGFGGVELLVRFSPRHAQFGTFRALLNGADVTEQLKVASNGAHGSLHGLLEGQNELRLEIFGSGWWPADLFVQESHTLRVLYRPPTQSNQG